MSFTPDPGVQPEGQGAATGGAPYQEYLDRIPEELRPQVEPVFKEWDSNTTKRFQESSQFRNQWEPYQQAGLHEHDPQTLAQLVEFARMTEDPDSYQEWLRGQAEQAGLLDPQPDPGLMDPSVEQLLQKQLSPIQQQMQQFQEWQQQQEFEAAKHAAQQQIQSQLSALREQHGEFPDDVVEKFAANYVQSDPENAVQRAFADYQKLVADIEKGVFKRKLEQPGAPEVGGAPDSQPPQITSLAEAAKVAAERLRQANTS